MKQDMPLILARACLALLHLVKSRRTLLEVAVVGLHAPVEKTYEIRTLIKTQREHVKIGAVVTG